MTYNFHVDELQDKYKYDMILVRDILSELNIDLCFSENKLGYMKARTQYVWPR